MIRSSQIISIVIADDHIIFRQGLKSSLQLYPHINIIGEACNGKELIDLIPHTLPDIIITDLQMPIMNGVVATELIKRDFPDIKVIVCTMFGQENIISRMFSLGVKGFILKNIDCDEMVKAINIVKAGGSYYSREIENKMAQSLGFNRAKINRIHLSDKENSIIKLTCEDKSNKEIGDTLNLSKRSVDGLRDRLKDKLGVKGTAGMVMYAVNNMFNDNLFNPL